MTKERLIELEKLSIAYFLDHTNLREGSPGFGLVMDHTLKPNVASIAATGFMLSALVIGVKRHNLDRNHAKHIAEETLKTMLRLPHQQGFIAHFLDMETGLRIGSTEYSTIDTALMLCGALTVDSFFQDESISILTNQLMTRMNWAWLTHEKNNKTMFYMAYNPDKGGDYVTGKPGFIHQWDMYAEQLMMYVMVAGSAFHHLAIPLYEGFERKKGSYEGITYIYSPGNSLFVYQFPLAWLDLKDVVDRDGISWFDNTVQATLAHEKASRMMANHYATFEYPFFGFSASDSPKGYRVFGGLPNHEGHVRNDGTASTFAMIGSLPFAPELSLKAMDAMDQLPKLWGPYGYYDAFNLHQTPWFSQRYISINKGLELLMMNAYLYGDVYEYFMKHPWIIRGMEVLQWKKRNGGKTPSSIKSTL
ncbi:MAG TPA: glucoamylase family protein [Acholeplasmataceae bacterium]|nr:glucoamylase family protein [Acholeplasmataceae bacterium]